MCGFFKNGFSSAVLAFTLIPHLPLLLILVCYFHSNCPHSAQSNSIRFAFQVEKLSQLLLSECNGRTQCLPPLVGVLLKASKQADEVFVCHKSLTKAVWGLAALSPLSWNPSHMNSGGRRPSAQGDVCDLGWAVGPRCLGLVARGWQWAPSSTWYAIVVPQQHSETLSC